MSLPYGKTHFEKNLEDNVFHELDMKTGLESTYTTYIGNLYQRITDIGVVLSHMLIHMYRVSVDEHQLLYSKQSGEVFWGDPSKL